MGINLKRILISPSQLDYKKRDVNGYDSEQNKTVVKILRTVAAKGDTALKEYTEKFDGVKLSPKNFGISSEELKAAYEKIKTAEPKLWKAILGAIKNVEKYQREIFIGRSKHPGIRYTTIKPIGICVPGAAAPLPSTVIMTAVPALVAGVKPQDINIVSPPRYKGSIHPVTLAVCYHLGIKNVFRIGGAQAVAALAYGTNTIPKVNKIVGPGNRWVQTAKKNVSADYAAIDSVAGPSEVLILADARANPEWVAADMLSQAEHGTDSSAILITTSKPLAEKVLAELERQLAELPRAGAAKESLVRFSKILVVKSEKELINYANELASEHLEIHFGKRSREIAEKIQNAGAIFIGDYSPVAVGDYWAGPSHTLPTGQRAKFSSALTSNDFVKSISIIEYDKKRLRKCAADIIRLAETEGLDAHARSVKLRTKD